MIPLSFETRFRVSGEVEVASIVVMFFLINILELSGSCKESGLNRVTASRLDRLNDIFSCEFSQQALAVKRSRLAGVQEVENLSL